MTVPTPAPAVTQCPHCSAKFRVRPEQVKLHAGLVRCGACRGIFDAVEHLIEGSLPPVPPMPEALSGESPRTIVQGMPAMSPMSSDGDDDNHHHDARSGVDSRQVTTSAIAATTVQDPSVRNLDTDTRGEVPGRVAGELNDYRWRAPSRHESRSVRWGYALASLLAALLLVGQAAYFFRDELVSRVPSAAPLMAMACEQIGCRVEPPRRAESLGFVGADLAADPAHRGLLIFTTTLRNTGLRTVAFPHLVLSLDGLGGELVVRRVFSPTEFAPATANLAHGLDGGAEVEIKLYLDASQVNVVGFKVDHAYL